MNWTEEGWQAAEAEWKEEGFLSPAAAKAETLIVRANRKWFEHAESLSRLGQAAFFEGSQVIAGQSTHDPVPLVCRMTLRAISAFQAIVLLCRRGMAIEGFTLARNLYEIAFWASYVAEKGVEAAADFTQDAQLGKLSALKLDRESHVAGVLSLDPETLRLIDEQIAAIPKRKRLDMKDIAIRAGLLDHYRTYKHVSMKYAHATLGSLFPLLNQKPDGSVQGHLYGPNEELTSETLQCASIAFGICLIAFSQAVGGTSQNVVLQELLIRTDSLRGLGTN
jgi:hypothetical protein